LDKGDLIAMMSFMAFMGFLAFMIMQRPANNAVQPTYVQLPPQLGGR